MTNFIRNISIGQYRGLKSLMINNLNNVNVIVGDNNSGKTSLFEAIYLLRSPHSFSNVLRASRLRNTLTYINPSTYESFINVFPKDQHPLNIYVNADGDGGYLSLEITGEEVSTSVTEEDLKSYPLSTRYTREKTLLGTETIAFIGTMYGIVNSTRKELDVRITPFSRNSAFSSLRYDSTNIVYMSPISHIVENTFYSIVKNGYYKDICIQLIRLFDSDIEDLVYMPNGVTGRAVEYIKSRKLGLIPLSAYGDGIKKVLSLANGIIEASDGILLIDEIDTSIHYLYYSDIFNFLVKAASRFNVQVFISTHSEEAIDEILKTQNYNDSSRKQYDPINVITLRKDEFGNIRSRSMNGFDVYTNRELFDFEVRL